MASPARQMRPPETPLLSSPDSRPLTTPSSVSSRFSTASSSTSSLSSLLRCSLRRDQSLCDPKQSLGEQIPQRASQSAKGGSPARSRQLDFNDQEEGGGDHGSEKTSKAKNGRNGDLDGSSSDEGPGYEASAADDGATPASGDRENSARSGEDDAELSELSSPEHMKARRKTVFWTEKEEEFLRKGVQQFGVGKWKKILLEGKGVFLGHRTNVDLKDKWKNLQLSKGKRRRFVGTKDEEEQQEEKEEAKDEEASSQPSTPRNKRRRRVKRRASTGSQMDELPVSPAELIHEGTDQEPVASSAPIVGRSQRQDGVLENDAMAAVATMEEVGTQPSGEQSSRAEAGIDSRDDEETAPYEQVENESEEKEESKQQDEVSPRKEKASSSVATHLPPVVTLKIGTDESFPNLQRINVRLSTCADVSALKARLRSSILAFAPADAVIELVELKSRRELKNWERLTQCIRKNGQEFFAAVEQPSQEKASSEVIERV